MRSLVLGLLVFSQLSSASNDFAISDAEISGAARVFIYSPLECKTLLGDDLTMGLRLTSALLILSKALGRHFEDPGDLTSQFNRYEQLVLVYLLAQPIGERQLPDGFTLGSGNFESSKGGTRVPQGLGTLTQLLNDKALLDATENRIRSRVVELKSKAF